MLGEFKTFVENFEKTDRGDANHKAALEQKDEKVTAMSNIVASEGTPEERAQFRLLVRRLAHHETGGADNMSEATVAHG